MPHATSSAEPAFLDTKLWNAADRLRSNLDDTVYKHAVLGLIFLKYISDAFDLRREEFEASFRNPKSNYALDRANGKTDKVIVIPFPKLDLSDISTTAHSFQTA